MMQPGTLKHDDPAEFTTKGISFFMTMPCFGDAEQNFKLMLKTAQLIADDLGANVLDDARNLMTPNRLDSYRAQIQQFKAAQQV
jgi:cell division protein ZipA